MPFPISFQSAILSTLGVCVCAAVLEGVCAGRNVKATFAQLRFPRYSLPLWAWFVVGAAYYALFFVIVFRILRTEGGGPLALVSLVLALKMMFINAAWNLLFFRLRSMFLSLILGIPYGVFAITLFVCLLKLDRVAALTLLPYLLYLCYAIYWGYELWKLNRDERRAAANSLG